MTEARQSLIGEAMATKVKPDSAATPMMAQYLALKAEAEGSLAVLPDGRFLRIVLRRRQGRGGRASTSRLTARGEHEGAPIPMCGVPIHAAEAYLARLIKAGHRVAIAEQVESPAEAKKRGAKSVVNRAIVRVVTAGTLTEEALLDSRSANWLVAVARVGRALRPRRRRHFDRAVRAGLDRPRRARRRAGAARPGRDRSPRAAADARPSRKAGFDSLAAERRLKERFEVATLDGFGAVRPRRLVRGGRAARLSRRGRARVAALPAAAGRARPRAII